MYITNIAAWQQATGSAGAGELYASTVNGVPVLIPNGVTSNYPYESSGPNGLGAGTWWVPGDVNQYGAVNINDTSTATRDLVAQAYNSLSNRFAGPVATEYWVDSWLYRGQQSVYSSVYDMIRNGWILSGEAAGVASQPYLIPFTRIAPQFACTDPSARNYQGSAAPQYQRLFYGPVLISNNSLCTYPITPTVSLTASPTEILNGSSSTLTWSTTNATSASIDGVSVSPVSGGTKTVTPTQSTSYTLSATSSTNTTATTSSIVTVRNLPTGTITLSPSSIKSGETSTLTWST
jgi:hypothetical protein